MRQGRMSPEMILVETKGIFNLRSETNCSRLGLAFKAKLRSNLGHDDRCLRRGRNDSGFS